MTEVRKKPRASRTHNLVRTGWLSNQHGAWAMMVVPLLVGSILGGFSWPQALLTFAWLNAFFFFNALGLAMKISSSMRARSKGAPLTAAQKASVLRRQKRYAPALITYGALAALGALALLVVRVQLLVWAPAFAILFGLAAWEVYCGRDRSFLARATAILASQMMTPIAFSLGTHPENWTRMWVATIILSLYFVGTIPYVKTLIRERGESSWLRLSIGYHAAVLATAVVLGALGVLTWWVSALWVLLLARAVAFPLWSAAIGKQLRPAVIGFAEMAVSVATVLTLVLPTALLL